MTNQNERNFNYVVNKKSKVSLEEIHLLFKEFEKKNDLTLLNKHSKVGLDMYLDQLFSFILNELKRPIIKKVKSQNLIKVRHEPQKTWLDSLDSSSRSFMKYLEHEKSYALSSIKASIRNLNSFFKYISEMNNNESWSRTGFSNLTKKDILSYEDYLINRHNEGKIEKSTIYKYLYVVHLFVEFLLKNKKIHFYYNVPSSLKNQGNRTNAYASTQDIIKLLDTTEQVSNFKLRDMCILLLIMELGIRPIEVTGLCVNDLRLSELLITVFCEKSGQRTLNISKDLSRLLRKYLETRDEYKPTHDSVFINVFGEPLSRNGLSSMILNVNKKAFGKAKINAKSLRHTYATNALDNLNDLEEVSKSMGHLHLASTEYYVHKSVKRLLKNTLPFNPLHQLSEGDEV